MLLLQFGLLFLLSAPAPFALILSLDLFRRGCFSNGAFVIRVIRVQLGSPAKCRQRFGAVLSLHPDASNLEMRVRFLWIYLCYFFKRRQGFVLLPLLRGNHAQDVQKIRLEGLKRQRLLSG